MNQSKNFRNECYEIISFFSKKDKDIWIKQNLIMYNLKIHCYLFISRKLDDQNKMTIGAILLPWL